MAGKIFINYRRQMTQGQAQHLADILARTFGKECVFIDVHGIEGFTDWLTVLKDEVAKTAVLVSVIGPGWLDVRDDSGRRRLDNPQDFVRFEIEEAISRDIPVLPVLLDGATLPARHELPENMRRMLRWQAMDLQAKRFEEDAKAIAGALGRKLPQPWKLRVWLGVGFLLVVLIGGLYAVFGFPGWPSPNAKCEASPPLNYGGVEFRMAAALVREDGAPPKIDIYAQMINQENDEVEIVRVGNAQINTDIGFSKSGDISEVPKCIASTLNQCLESLRTGDLNPLKIAAREPKLIKVMEFSAVTDINALVATFRSDYVIRRPTRQVNTDTNLHNITLIARICRVNI